MYDYMKALHDRFVTEPDISQVKLDIEAIHHQLIDELSKEQRRKVLMLIDLEDELRNEMSLHCFVEGFRTAFGLTAELNLTEPYNYAREMEQRAWEQLRKEV